MYRHPFESYKPVHDYLGQNHSIFEKDPFLESIFWEQAGFCSLAQKDLPAALVCYQMAVRHGYPAAHFYNNIGMALALSGRYGEARAVFVKVLKAPVNRTMALENLQRLDAMEKPSSTIP